MTADRDEMERHLLQAIGNPDLRLWRLDFNSLSVPEQVCRTVWELESEVNQGGFSAYFFNSSGEHAGNAADALAAIGAAAMARITREAVATIGEGTPWANHKARQDRVNDLPEEAEETLEELDQAFQAYPDDLTVLLYRYVSTHRSDIVAPEGPPT